MLTPKYFRLLLAAFLAISSTLLVVGAYRASGSTPKSLTAKVLRRHDKIRERLSPKEIGLLRGQVPQKEERVLEGGLPKDLPIRVKIKPEKEKAFKDLDNEHWARDLEIEVKNTGEKPIYYLVLILDLPDIRIGNTNLVVVLRFGRKEMSLFGEKPEPAKVSDPSIKPSETYVFRVQKELVESLEESARAEGWLPVKKVVIKYEQLSFGDGTGFRSSTKGPWPPPGTKTSRSSCRQDEDSGRWKFPQGGSPASYLPAKFLYASRISFLNSIEPNLEPDDCCPTGCSWVHEYDDTTRCYGRRCESVHRAEYAYCTDPTAHCAVYELKLQLCLVYEDGYHYAHNCPIADTRPCESGPPPSPSPSPSSSPSPSCNPTTKPNDANCQCVNAGDGTVDWLCQCSDGSEGADHKNPSRSGNFGCPANKVNDGSDCCVCVDTLDCGDGCHWDPYFCRCVDLIGSDCEAPLATPSDGNPIYSYNCIDYYWVYFVSYDGGITWEYDHTEYAGCYYA